MPEIKGKYVVLDNDVYQRLKDVGKKGETFSDIVRRLLDAYDLRVEQDQESDSITTPKE